MPGADPAPRWLWRALTLLLALVLIGGGAAIILLRLGIADPPLAGPLAWERRAPEGGCLDVGGLALPAWGAPATLIASARVDAPPDALTRWGVWLGAPDDGPRWEILPPGYFIHAGQTMPFWHVGAGVTDLRLDLAAAGYTLWLNRERALAGALPPLPGGAWGVTGGDGVCWQRLALYRPN